ncbi:MAG TPA: aminopeptidase [Gemmatimonadales bacterium]|nr:aminopeptidase [Gemmatimonadales bacterium]
MGLLIAAALLLGGYATAYVASEDVRYVTRAGIEETKILTARVPMVALLRDSATSPELRAAAGLVVAARDYARQLGLDAGETYTTFSRVERDTLLLVLTASPPTCLCPVTWSFPIVGRIPYKGYFDFAKAEAAARGFRDDGYDVNLRPSAAFSTLGWFNDPLLSTAIDRDSVELAALVFHEITHNTIWVDGATDFNESVAQWVGYRAAEQFFLARADTGLALRARDRWHDEQVLGRYYDLLLGKLDSLYALRLPPDANQAGREAIARWSADTLRDLVAFPLRTVDATRLGGRPINNAALLGVRLYRTRLDVFDDFDQQHGRDLGIAIYRLQEAVADAEGPEAFRRIAVLAGRRDPIDPE